jgi:sugar lactone lactonase YvrE
VQLGSNQIISTIEFGPRNNLNVYPILFDLFATNTSLYVIDANNYRVQKSSLNGSSLTTILQHNTSLLFVCLFVDKNDNIYFSDWAKHRVVFFRSNSTNGIIVAGTGAAGRNYSQLTNPYGLFVNEDGIIYIADTGNHRIMRWFAEASSGIMVAGNGTPGNSLEQLYSPHYVIVDTNEYMYIADKSNSRIVRWAPNSTSGVCIAASLGVSGIAPTQLYLPVSLAFDSNGSLHVADFQNNRIQKFQILLFESEYAFEVIYSVLFFVVVTDPSYNQPKLSSCAIWNHDAITFINNSILGLRPARISINTHNTIAVSVADANKILI